MAGGHVKYRALSRSSAHRQALLRNLVTSLFQSEAIQTTWHKAKEAQRLADKLVTLGKRNTIASRRRAQQIFFVSFTLLSTPVIVVSQYFMIIGKVPRAAVTNLSFSHIRTPNPSSQSSSAPSVNATSTDPAATPASYTSNHPRKTKPNPPSSSSSTDRPTCASV